MRQKGTCKQDINNPLKESLATTEASSLTPSFLHKNTHKNEEKKHEITHTRHISELRNTVSAKVPLGNNFKRDLLLKSHSKLI